MFGTGYHFLFRVLTVPLSAPPEVSVKLPFGPITAPPAVTVIFANESEAGLKNTPDPSWQGSATPAPARPIMQAPCS